MARYLIANVRNAQGLAETLHLHAGHTAKVKAAAGTQYQFADAGSGAAAEYTGKRVGNDLHLLFGEEAGAPQLVLEDYYLLPDAEHLALDGSTAGGSGELSIPGAASASEGQYLLAEQVVSPETDSVLGLGLMAGATGLLMAGGLATISSGDTSSDTGVKWPQPEPPTPLPNHAPTDIALSASTVAENVAGAVIGILTTTDADAKDTHTYTVSDNRFEVVNGKLKLKAGEKLEFASEPSVTLDITTDDGQGGSYTESFTLSVEDDPNYPAPSNNAPTDITLSASTAAENVAGAVIGTLTTTDADANDTHTYTVSDSRFEVVNGELKLKAGEKLEFASEPSVTLDITTNDGKGGSYTETFTISVTDDPSYPTPQPNSAGSIAISGVLRGGEELTATISDSNGVPTTVQYQWYADGVAISGATGQTFTPDWQQVGKTLHVQASYTDNAGYSETPRSASSSEITYGIYTHAEYGRYVDAREFGADASGQTDSSAALQVALQAAHTEGVALYLGEGTFHLDSQLVLDSTVGNVTAVFGAGMGQTTLVSDTPQIGTYNSLRTDSVILLDALNGKTLGDFSVRYEGEFYRPGESHFGNVSGIQVNEADNTTIQRVEVSGANRAGVSFGSAQAVRDNAAEALLAGRITADQVPVGEGNRIIDSNLHHNRAGGIFVAFQKDFTADGNTLARNGHEDDGATGYGIALIGGTYNDGINITNNTTDHNYRKGIDVHDGNNLLIAHNTLNGDRLYGISTVARTFAMRDVVIRDNDITFDPAFHVFTDDDTPDNVGFNDYQAIELQTNYEHSNHASSQEAVFTISGNTLRGLNDYSGDPGSTITGIRFGHHEADNVPYTLAIRDNTAGNISADYFIHINNQSNATGNVSLLNNHATFSGTSRGITLEGVNAASTINAQNNTLNGESISPSSTSANTAADIFANTHIPGEAYLVVDNFAIARISAAEMDAEGREAHIIISDGAHHALLSKGDTGYDIGIDGWRADFSKAGYIPLVAFSNGNSDIHAALDGAIAAAQSANQPRIIELPTAQAFTSSKPITLPGDIQLHGNDSSIRVSGQIGDAAVEIVQGQGGSVENLHLDMSNAAGVFGIRAYDIENYRISNNHIDKLTASGGEIVGIVLYNGDGDVRNVSVENNHISAPTGDAGNKGQITGIYVQAALTPMDPAYSNALNPAWMQFVETGNARQPEERRTVENISIRGNHIEGGYYGIGLSGVQGGDISQNHIENNTRNISLQDSTSGITIRHNLLEEALSSAVHIAYGANGNTISDNHIVSHRAGGQAILQAYQGSDNNVFSNNHLEIVHNSAGRLFYTATDSSGTRFENNIASGRARASVFGAEALWDKASSGNDASSYASNMNDPNLYTGDIPYGGGTGDLSGMVFSGNILAPALTLASAPVIYLGADSSSGLQGDKNIVGNLAIQMENNVVLGLGEREGIREHEAGAQVTQSGNGLTRADDGTYRQSGTVYTLNEEYTLQENDSILYLLANANANGQGNSANNTLHGNAHANTLQGGAGNDVLNGGHGADTLSGGTGADTFVLQNRVDGNNIDTITDFNKAQGDKIGLSVVVFGKLEGNWFAGEGEKATSETRIQQNGKTLSYDADGSGTGHQSVAFATLSNSAVLDEQDFVHLTNLVM